MNAFDKKAQGRKYFACVPIYSFQLDFNHLKANSVKKYVIGSRFIH